MIPDPERIPAIVQDYLVLNNCIFVLRMIVHEAFEQYQPKVIRYKASRFTTPLASSRLEGRIRNLEARQTLVEGELVLLNGQLNRQGVSKT